jgi:hypothetical protein
MPLAAKSVYDAMIQRAVVECATQARSADHKLIALTEPLPKN